MRINPSKAWFIGALCVASFGYGAGTVHCRVFPFGVLQNANRAWQALTAIDDDCDRDVKEVQGLKEPCVRRYSAAAGDEMILVAGGNDFLREHSPDHGCLAWIMDREGKVMHVWHFDPGIWANFEHVASVPGKAPQIYPVGLHLYADGGLLVSFQGFRTFPFGIGLARFDKDSKLLWKKELMNHHWFTVAADGRIYAPAMRTVDPPYTVGDTRFSISSADGKMLKDVVMIFDDAGDVLDEIPVLDAVIESGWAGLLRTQGATATGKLNDERFVIMSGDPTHLNGVQLVDAQTAAAHRWLNEGDLLLSMRHMNALGILDAKTRRFKWMLAGAGIQQHSPRFHREGLLFLDNRGGPAAAGGSQLVQIDLDTRLPRTVFPRVSVSLPGEFYTSVAGQLDLSGSDRILVALTIGQKIWEINLKTGEVLWEYICVDPQQHRQRRMHTAKYVQNVNFPFNKQSESTP